MYINLVLSNLTTLAVSSESVERFSQIRQVALLFTTSNALLIGFIAILDYRKTCVAATHRTQPPIQRMLVSACVKNYFMHIFVILYLNTITKNNYSRVYWTVASHMQ